MHGCNIAPLFRCVDAGARFSETLSLRGRHVLSSPVHWSFFGSAHRGRAGRQQAGRPASSHCPGGRRDAAGDQSPQVDEGSRDADHDRRTARPAGEGPSTDEGEWHGRDDADGRNLDGILHRDPLGPLGAAARGDHSSERKRLSRDAEVRGGTRDGAGAQRAARDGHGRVRVGGGRESSRPDRQGAGGAPPRHGCTRRRGDRAIRVRRRRSNRAPGNESVERHEGHGRVPGAEERPRDRVDAAREPGNAQGI